VGEGRHWEGGWETLGRSEGETASLTSGTALRITAIRNIESKCENWQFLTRFLTRLVVYNIYNVG